MLGGSVHLNTYISEITTEAANFWFLRILVRYWKEDKMVPTEEDEEIPLNNVYLV